MQREGITCSAQLAGEGSKSGHLILRLNSDSPDSRTLLTVADRVALASEWAADLDAQYRDLIRAGRSPQVVVPLAVRSVGGLTQYETADAYRRLRLGVGELIRPVLMDPPELDELFPFQRIGVEWLRGQAGAILADDMGLGKTVQVISAIRLLFNRAELRTVLVMCPKGLMATWKREFTRWAPELGVAAITPNARIREDVWKIVIGYCHVVLTNYEQMRDPPMVLRGTGVDLIVADEAHRLRNRSAQVTSGSFRLRPGRFWALTGTPVERDVEDLATLLSLVAPASFAPSDAKHPASLRSRARHFMLRRRKREVLKELPPVLDRTEALELSEGQRRAYEEAVKQYRRRGRPGDELALLTRLQVICDIDVETGESSKAERILQLLGRIREEGEKAVVFSYRLEPLRLLQRRIGESWEHEAAVLLVGEMDSEERDHSLTFFRRSERALALLASSRVGGEGLTLVEANHVFMFNQWWNPSANDQARDRVVRVGQERGVRVYRFSCRRTIEERLERILESKREVFVDAVERLAEGESSGWRPLLRDVGIEQLVSQDDG